MNSPEIALPIDSAFTDKICVVKKVWHELNSRMCLDLLLYSCPLLSLLCNSFQELHAQSCSGDEKCRRQKTRQILQSVQLCSQLTCGQPNANSFVRWTALTTSVLTHSLRLASADHTNGAQTFTMYVSLIWIHIYIHFCLEVNCYILFVISTFQSVFNIYHTQELGGLFWKFVILKINLLKKKVNKYVFKKWISFRHCS